MKKTIPMNWYQAGVLFMAFLFTGCAASKQLSGVNDLLQEYHVKDVRVSFADKVDIGVFKRLDNEDDKDFVERVGASIEKTVRESIVSSLDGPTPANIAITLTEVAIASGVGRALGGHDSTITGIVEIVDANSSTVLAERAIKGKDRSTKMGGNIGALVSLISNATNAATTDRVEEAVNDFSIKLRDWIEK